MAEVDKSFDEACNGRDKRPAEQQVQQSHAGFVQVEFVHSQTAQEDRQKNCDASAPGRNCRERVEVPAALFAASQRIATGRAGPGFFRYGLSAFGAFYKRHFLFLQRGQLQAGGPVRPLSGLQGPRPPLTLEVLHDGLLLPQLVEKFSCFGEIVKGGTDTDEFLAMFVRAAIYPLYPYRFGHAGECGEKIPYAPFEDLNPEHRRVAPDRIGVPVDLKHLLD